MKVLLSMHVNKWLKHEKNISSVDLIQAAKEVTKSIFDANLGGGIYKKRIANNKGKGKSGGARLLIAYKTRGNLFFIYAFNKNELDNISIKEKNILKQRAKIYFEMTEKELTQAIRAKVFYELQDEKL